MTTCCSIPRGEYEYTGVHFWKLLFQSFSHGDFQRPAKQPRKAGWPPAGPDRDGRYSARSQHPRIDAVSHQAGSLILIRACYRRRIFLLRSFRFSFFFPSRRQAENVPFSFGCIPVVLIRHFLSLFASCFFCSHVLRSDALLS